MPEWYLSEERRHTVVCLAGLDPSTALWIVGHACSSPRGHAGSLSVAQHCALHQESLSLSCPREPYLMYSTSLLGKHHPLTLAHLFLLTPGYLPNSLPFATVVLSLLELSILEVVISKQA